MHLSLRRNVSRLPKRFPVGTTYVVEGRSGQDGDLRVFSRYVVLPDGERINLGADLGNLAVPRARRARGRQTATPSGMPSRGKRRVPGAKKISANGGTPRRNRR